MRDAFSPATATRSASSASTTMAAPRLNGVPETFVVSRGGTIVYKLVGPLTPDNINSVLKTEIDEALNGGT